MPAKKVSVCTSLVLEGSKWVIWLETGSIEPGAAYAKIIKYLLYIDCNILPSNKEK